MKIGIFTNNYLPNPYGVSGSIESFRKQFESRGHEVFIFAPRWKGYEDENPNVFRYPSVDIEIKIKFPLAIPYSKKMDKIISELDLDIIHSQHPNLLGSTAKKWARKKNIPLVFTWHTLYDQYVHFFPFLPAGISSWWTIRNARSYANRADAVIAPTPTAEKIIRGWGVANKNVSVIPSGVEEEIFRNPDGESIRKKYGVQEDETCLLVISRLTQEKNMEFLFKAVTLSLKRNEKIKFLVGGEGYLQEKLKNYVKESGVERQVIFAGFVSGNAKKDYYAAGDIFVYASKSETQGMILSEAMYSGLPLVAVKAPGAQDLIEDGVNGLLVSESSDEFAAAIEKIIADKKLREKFSENSKKIGREKYANTVCAEKMLEVYAEAIQRKNS